MEYADEPRLLFTPLDEKDYSSFYSLEMDGFADDAPFYTSLLHKEDRVLELGCGTGRLTRLLAQSCGHITGIDCSLEMLRLASHEKHDNVVYRHMDMLDLSFPSPFDTIIIPYNTLNLLKTRERVEKCLHLCRECLKKKGILAMQLHMPDPATRAADETRKVFQFAVFDDKNNGKVIKETLKCFHEPSATLDLEERYRIRPAVGSTKKNRDLRHVLKLYTPEFRSWKTILQECGFSIHETMGNPMGKTFCSDNDTSLFIQAKKN